MRVPFVNLTAQQGEIAEEIRAGLDEVFGSTSFIGGRAVSEFEAEYAEFVGTRYCVGVANGTDALELALRAVGVSAGGEVVLPANTFIATAEAVSRIGARPRLVDVDDVHLLIDPAEVEKAITPTTQAIVPVHLFGQAAPTERLAAIAANAGVPLVEDAAQSQGARRHGRAAGSLGVVAATSFYPGKNLGAAGDAGAVTTDDHSIATLVRMLGSHGSKEKYVHEVVGMNSRLDAVQAVVLRAKLARLEKWNQQRRNVAEVYRQLLGELPGVRVPLTAQGNEDVWHLFVIRVPDRNLVVQELHNVGVGVGIHYPTPLHLTRAYAHLGLGIGSYPVSERAAESILSLPMHPHVTLDQQEYVVTALSRILSGTRP